MTALDPNRRLAPVDWAAPPGDPISQVERQMVRSSQFTQAALDRLVDRLATAEAYVAELVTMLQSRGVLEAPDQVEPAGENQEEPDAYAPAAPGSNGSAPAPGSPDSTAAAPGLAGSNGSATASAAPNGSAPSLVRNGQEVDESDMAVSWPSIAFRVDPEAVGEGIVEVDCEARLPICHAVCCKLNFALTPPEVDSGAVKWDLGFPYLIRHEANGYCTHCDTGSGRCAVYADRPGVCRRYSCANDRRIWSDFEGMVLNEDWIRDNLSNRGRIFVRTSLPVMDAGAVAEATGPQQFQTA